MSKNIGSAEVGPPEFSLTVPFKKYFFTTSLCTQLSPLISKLKFVFTQSLYIELSFLSDITLYINVFFIQKKFYIFFPMSRDLN